MAVPADGVVSALDSAVDQVDPSTPEVSVDLTPQFGVTVPGHGQHVQQQRHRHSEMTVATCHLTTASLTTMASRYGLPGRDKLTGATGAAGLVDWWHGGGGIDAALALVL